MQSTFDARRPRVSMFLITLAVSGALMLGAASGYLFKTLQARSSAPAANRAPAIDLVTGYPSDSLDDQRILALLKQSGYEGGATVVKAIDPITGYPSGSDDDQRILAILKQSGYEGGATVVKGASAGASAGAS